jgi:hypothetical protein
MFGKNLIKEVKLKLRSEILEFLYEENNRPTKLGQNYIYKGKKVRAYIKNGG